MVAAMIIRTMVLLSGAAVLMLELVGTRVLGPTYGVSLYLWAAMLSVTLLALSLGYWAGAGLSRQPGAARKLAFYLGLAALWCLAAEWLRFPLLKATGGMPVVPGVTLCSLVLFGPPLALMGMVSPVAIQLAANDWDRAGRTAGEVMAISTVGSVLGALATGFVLIPLWGVPALLRLIAAVLAVAAALSFQLGAAKIATERPSSE